VDVFFVFSYSANARFEHGIIIYSECSHPPVRVDANSYAEDKMDIEELEKEMNKEPGNPKHSSNSPQTTQNLGDEVESKHPNRIADINAHE
jgi:hypothetical protein